MQIGKAFDTLFGTVCARGLARPYMRMIGICLDDSDIVAAAKLRSIACVTSTPGFSIEAPFERRTIEGGDYAVLRHKGPYAELYKTYQRLYSEWLPKSGLKDSVFEEYLNNPRDVPPTELMTDIPMPIA